MPAVPAPAEADRCQAGDLFDHLFTTDELREATSGRAWVDAMLAFERELAAAQAELGILPHDVAAAIAAAASDLRPEPSALGVAARGPGNPAAPLVQLLREAVGPEVAPSVHLGATSQDALDTAAMLVARRAGGLVAASLDRACDAAASLADEHRGTVLAARTLLQQALPTTFGLKAAGWLVAMDDAGRDLARVLDGRLAVQLGGAAGTAAALGERGPAVARILAGRLGLAEPVLPWHTDRVRVGELASALAVAAGAGAKVALDVVLLSQTEVGEVAGDAGGSSTLPHKRNPTRAVLARASGIRATGLAATLLTSMAQEHERAAGAWHAEWPALTELLRATGGCLDAVAGSLGSLRVDAGRMGANLEAGHGVLMAERVLADLAGDLGWDEAGALVRAATEQALAGPEPFASALAGLAPVAQVRSRAQLEALCDPAGYLGAAGELVDRALAARHAASGGEPER